MKPRLFLSAALLLPHVAQAHPEPDPAKLRRRLAKLDITTEQAQELVPLLDEAAGLRSEGCELVEALAPDALEAWTALRDIVAVDGTPDPEIWRTAGRVERELKDGREELAVALVAIEEEALAALGASQLAMLERRGRSELAPQRSELQALSKQRHPKPGPFGMALLHPVVAAEIYAQAGKELPETWVLSGQACDAVEEDREELRELKGEISAWNLLNGLHVDASQAATLLAAEDEALAEAALTPGQWEVLRSFSPCLLPPQDLSNPVRAGQAGAGGIYERWLDRARTLDPARQVQVVQRLLSREERHFGPLPEGRAEEVSGILAEASALDEVDYALREPDLLERLVRVDELHDARIALFEAQRAAGGEGLVGHFLLSDAFQDVLTQRFDEEG